MNLLGKFAQSSVIKPYRFSEKQSLTNLSATKKAPVKPSLAKPV